MGRLPSRQVVLCSDVQSINMAVEESRDSEVTDAATGIRKLSFSFGRFLTNAVPNFANDNVQASKLTAAEIDLLFTHQLRRENPKTLDPVVFYFLGICANEKFCKQTYDKLIDTGVLLEKAPNVDTTKIGPNFAHQHAKIAVHLQRKLVNLVFDWEEELMRWRLLEEEKAEIGQVKSAIRDSAGGETGHFDMRLKEIEGEMRVPPSLRGDRARAETELPGYSNAASSAS